MKNMITIGVMYSGLLILLTVFSAIQTLPPQVSNTSLVPTTSPTSAYVSESPFRQPSTIIDTPTGIKQPMDTPTESDTIPVPERLGNISIASSPQDAQVFFNGQFKGFTPMTMNNLEPDEYQIELKLSGYIFQTHNVVVTAGQTSRIQATLIKVPVRDTR